MIFVYVDLIVRGQLPSWQLKFWMAMRRVGPVGLTLTPVCRWQTRPLMMWLLLVPLQFYIWCSNLLWSRIWLWFSTSLRSIWNLTCDSTTGRLPSRILVALGRILTGL